MSLTAYQIAHLVEEIGPMIQAGTIRKVWSNGPESILLEIRVPGANRFLALHVGALSSRLHFIDSKPVQPGYPKTFIMLLRKHLIGTRIFGIAQHDGDRVIHLNVGWTPNSLDTDEPPAEAVHYTVVAELMGRGSRIFLLNGTQVLGAIGPGKRMFSAGQAYTSPEPPQNPHEARDPLNLVALAADGSRSEATAKAYTHQELHSKREDTARVLLRRLRKALKSLKRKEKAISKDLEKAEAAKHYRVWGELLQSAYGQVARGTESVEVPDYYAEGTPLVTVPLDPALDLKENIARYFKRYRRYSSAIPDIEQRLEGIWERLELLNTALSQAKSLAEQAKVLDDNGAQAQQKLIEFGESLEQKRVLPAERVQKAARKRQSAQPALPYREFASKTGKIILVGKGGRHNDTLSIRIAKGNDLWLHAHDWAGAHVVVRLTRNEEVDHQTLLDAATLAAHYSKGRNDTLVDVIYTLAKHVRKPKNLPPGRVTVAATRTIAVRIEQDRLTRLFE